MANKNMFIIALSNTIYKLDIDIQMKETMNISLTGKFGFLKI